MDAISIRAYPNAKVHSPGSFFPYRRYAAIRLPEGALPGDRFLFRFRDVSMQTYEEVVDAALAVVLANVDWIGQNHMGFATHVWVDGKDVTEQAVEAVADHWSAAMRTIHRNTGDRQIVQVLNGGAVETSHLLAGWDRTQFVWARSCCPSGA